MDYPFAKMRSLWFLKAMFSLFRKAFAIKNVENRFFTIYFHDLLHGNTGGYYRLQGVREGYKGLQGVTRGYKR